MKSNPNPGGRNHSFQLDIEPVTAHVAASYHNANGGSSFYVHGGERATEGFAVGGHGIPETTIESPTISDQQYQEHRDKVRRLVKDPLAVAGSWVEGGKSVLDSSTVVPSRDTAKQLQKKRGERAVFNLKSGKEENLL